MISFFFQSMDPNILTISLSRWMSLPDLDLRHWQKLVEAEKQEPILVTEKDMYTQEKSSKKSSRISMGIVAAYYKDYVHRKGLERYFRWYVL